MKPSAPPPAAAKPPAEPAARAAAAPVAQPPKTSEIPPSPIAVPSPPRREAGGQTYTASDADVSPPAVVTPQLLGMLAQSSPGNRPEIMTIAVVVDEHGTVESVKAINVPVTIGESVMLTAALSAVKAWHFRPAMKDGEPVRYRQIVPLRISAFTP